MEGTIDPFDFVLAEALHMTLSQLRDAMPNSEYLQWRAFYRWRAEEQELARKTAEAQRGR